MDDHDTIVKAEEGSANEHNSVTPPRAVSSVRSAVTSSPAAIDGKSTVDHTTGALVWEPEKVSGIGALAL